jgi:hypothetical protein
MPSGTASHTTPRGRRQFRELDEVALAQAIHVQSAGRDLPAGARGTVVGIWRGGLAYEVEFAMPFACLVTVPAEGLSG